MKRAVIFIITFIVLWIISDSIIGGLNIFPCLTKPVVANMASLPWKESTCDLRIWTGSARRFTTSGVALYVGLLYLVPLILAGIVTTLITHKKKEHEISQ